MLPVYAETIVEARQRRLRPDEVVFVSLGKLGVHAAHPDNHCTIVTTGMPIARVDFAWCLGLDVELVAERVVRNDRALLVIDRIVAAQPQNLVAWETSSGRRWWLVERCGPWPAPYLLYDDADRTLKPREVLHAACP